MGITSTSNQARIEELARKFKYWQKELNEYNIIFSNIKKELIALMKLEKIDKVESESVKLVEESLLEQLQISEVLKCFNSNEIADYVVVSVNLNKTRNNLKIKLGFNDDLIDKVIERLKEKTTLKTHELVVGER